MSPDEKRVEVFWGVVEKTGTCWLWKRPSGTHGYGQFLYQGRNWRAHRLAYTLAVGPIPDGLVLDHLCRNTLCVNPAHLDPVTHRVNVVERGMGVSAKHARMTHCTHGHPLSGSNLRVEADGRRRCRACGREVQRRHMERKRNGAV